MLERELAMISHRGKPHMSADRGEEPQKQRSLKAGLVSRLGDWREWLNLILLFVALEIAVLSLERVRWITPQPSLTLVLILSMLTVWLLVISRLPGVVIHFLALIIGASVTYWQAQSLLSYRETIYFAVFLTFLTWVMGYLSTWFILRKKNAWVAVCLGALVILVNLSNLPGGYYFYFGFFFVAAVFLLVQTRLVRRHYFLEQGIRYTGQGLLYFVTSLTCLVILAVAVSWVTPEVRIPQLQTMIATRILWKNDIEKSKFNIFAAVPSKQSLSTSSMRLSLSFEPSWHQGDQVDFIVNSKSPSYWQVRAYNIYTSRGWENGPVADYVLESKTPWGGTAIPSNSSELTYTVTPNIKTDALLTSGSFISSNKPVLVQVGSGDIVGVLASHILSPGERYSVTAAVAQATPDELARASQDYPPPILDNYLQLPPDFPESIRQLSANITAGARTPYQKVLIINAFLSRIPYKTEVTPPPQGTDGVAYFLFTQKSGFCVHFASAMAVMLRSVGVPSRLAVGYLPGDPGNKKGEYILRDKLYHAWPQVYFPEYGWVDIEATPSSSEGAGSEVALQEPWISSETISNLSQWDVWFSPAMYGLSSGPDGKANASSVKSLHAYPGPWPFADKLGQALLIIIIIIFFLALLLIPFLVLRSSFYRWVWHVDRADLTFMTYEKLCQLGSMLKLGPRPQQTPLEYAAVLTAEFPEQANALHHITQAYLEKRFGRREGSLDLFAEAELLKARCSIYDKLLKRLSQAEKIFSGRPR
jgi:transglutaminase-like putative cysteine protease